MTYNVFEQQIMRLNNLLDKQVGKVQRMKSKGDRSPFEIRENMDKMFSLEDQINQLELILTHRNETNNNN